MDRRTFLRRTLVAGSAALSAACSRKVSAAAELGSLAWVDKQTLWIRDLPDGVPQEVATGHRIASPRFSPLGQWITFRDGEVGWMASADGKVRKPWNGGPWIPGRDELASGVRTGENLTISPAGVYAWIVRTRPKDTLVVNADGKTITLDQTPGVFEIAGFSRSGEWLLYWKQNEKSVSAEADGLELFAVATGGGAPRSLGVVTLIHPDMIAISAAGNAIAVTAGAGRETWASKRIGIIDLNAATPAVSYLTEPTQSAQLPAWSPDGKMLAWCMGPDAEVENKSRLMAGGQKTVRVIDGNGKRRDIPITPELRLSAPDEVVQQCLQLRRIVTVGIGVAGGVRQLTSNAGYSDERPEWSRDGSHILFCRKDRSDAETIWMMRNDGSEQQQIAGPLNPPADLTEPGRFGYKGFYGYTNWGNFFDWWRGA